MILCHIKTDSVGCVDKKTVEHLIGEYNSPPWVKISKE